MNFFALKTLYLKYKKEWLEAWHDRAKMTPFEYKKYEMDFSPHAVGLRDKPFSPTPRTSMWFLISFFTIAFIWTVFGKIDIVATAQGKIVPNDRSKTIQAFETATVKRILVSDGQNVKAGDMLIELDATTANADQERVQNDLAMARLQVARGYAFLKALEQLNMPTLERPNQASDAQYLEAQKLLADQVNEYRAKLERIDAEILRRTAELHSTQEIVNKLLQITPITRERAEDLKRLANMQAVAKHEYLERAQMNLEQESNLANQKSHLQELLAAIKEGRAQRLELMTQTRRSIMDSITEAQQKVATLEQEHLKAESRSQLMQLSAPVAGTVQQLAMHTVGGVVTPAQALMVIVPKDNPLEVEAFIENKDIGFVKPGQNAEVKIETFQYTKYGIIHAKVSSVSHDAINDEKRGLIYSTRIKMNKANIWVDGTPVNLSPGMAVSVEVKTGKRRVIDYFLSPLIQYANESFRER